MVKAGALVYVVAISLLIAIISSSLILLSFLNRQEFDFSVESLRLLNNARSGINLALLDPGLNPNSNKTLDLFGAGRDSVSLMKKNWGLFPIVISTAFSKHRKQLDIALVGYGRDSLSNYALRLGASNSPLTLCGATLITGNCFLPATGIANADMEGKHASGKISGTIKTSTVSNPSTRDAIAESIKAMFQVESGEMDSVIEYQPHLLGDSISNSFNRKTIRFSASESIVLENCLVEGNIFFSSTKSIHVKASCRLKDVILCAPSVEFEDGFSGSVQIFSSDSLIIGKKCRFKYPSVAAMFRSKNKAQGALLCLKDDVKFSGVLYQMYEEYDARYPSEIRISKGDIITGQIVTNGSLELHGIVNGSVSCSSFILHAISGIYSNYLFDAQIDITRLPSSFAGIHVGTGKTNDFRIIKWLF